MMAMHRSTAPPRCSNAARNYAAPPRCSKKSLLPLSFGMIKQLHTFPRHRCHRLLLILLMDYTGRAGGGMGSGPLDIITHGPEREAPWAPGAPKVRHVRYLATYFLNFVAPRTPWWCRSSSILRPAKWHAWELVTAFLGA